MIFTKGCQNRNDIILFKTPAWIIIKLSIVLLVLVNYPVFAKDNFTPKITIIKNNVHLVDVFKSIERQTGFLFFYDKAMIQKTAPIDVVLKDASLDLALSTCLRDYKLSYSIVKNTIVIQSTKISLSQFQNIKVPDIIIANVVEGKVTNSKKEPLVGVSVTIKGTSTGTSTDVNGNFSIDVPGNGTLVLSYVGFITEEVSVNDRRHINVTLSETNKALDEVVVTGYTTQSKKDITGSVSVISSSQIINQPSANTEQMLQGKASGLNIISSGDPGAPINIRIRGISTFGDNSPLVIIDGVQSNLSDIDANDIESISVLKDAGAAAIYGVRGSNGVIVITSKKGKSSKPKISYRGSYGVTVPFSGNVYNLLDTKEMAKATWEAYKNAGQVGANGNPVHPQYGNGPEPVIPDYILVGNKSGVTGTLTEEELDSYNIDYTRGSIFQIVKANKEGTNWYEEVSQKAISSSHNLSVSNSSAGSNYYFSAGYLDEQGTTKGTYYKRYNIRSNTSFKIKDILTIGENAYVYARERPTSYSGTISTSDINNPRFDAFLEQPIIPVYDIKGNYAGTRAGGLGQARNPYAVAIENSGYSNSEWGVQGNIFGQIDIMKNLSFRTSFGGMMTNNNNYNFQRRTYENADNSPSNIYSQGSSYSYRWTFTNIFEYKRVFGNHKLNGLIGVEAVNYNFRNISGTSAGYFVDNIDFLTLSSGSGNFTNASSKSANRLESQFGKLNYNFKDKYIIEGTLRRDGSSRFSIAKRWGVFPAVSLGWRLSDEGFMNNLTWISNLMLKGSIGKLGNEINVDPTNAFTQYSSSIQNSYYDINGTISSPSLGYRLSRIGSNATGWEEDKLTNIGLDMSLFKNKLDFSLEYYSKKINGLLFTDQAPATVGGATLPTINIGDIQNSGLDFNLNLRGGKKDFTFNAGLNVTSYNSKVIKIPGGFFDDGNTRTGFFVRNQEGHPVGAFFGYKILGLFSGIDDVAKSPKQNGAGPGRFKYADINNDNEITAADRTFIGDPNPDFTYGINLNVNYKDFGLTLFFYGSQGNDVVNYQKWWTDFFPSFGGVKSKNMLYNSWTSENLNAKTPINENVSNFSNNGVPNSYYIEDGSFLKLKSLMLNYNIRSKSLSQIGLNNFKAFIQIRNLFTLTKYEGLDPEIGGTNSAFGIDWGGYPNNEINYSLGLSFDLN